MKIILKLTLAVSLSLLGISESHAQWGNKKVVGNGNVTTKSVSTGNYDGIKGVGPMDIHLVKGTEGAITVTTDDNLHEYLDIEVKNNILIVKTEKNVNIKTRKGIHITVPFNDISEVSMVGSGDIDSKDTIVTDDFESRITGSGDIELSVKADNVEASITGSGDLALSGTTNSLDVSVTGSGDFHGSNLISQDTEARVSGSGDVRVVAKQTLKARVSGSGDIVYSGNPERSDTKASGSGDISSF